MISFEVERCKLKHLPLRIEYFKSPDCSELSKTPSPPYRIL